MPFVEYDAAQARPPGPQRRTWRQNLTALAIGPVVVPAFLLLNMFPALARVLLGARTTRVECDGWRAEWITPRAVCSCCHACILRLELNGAAYAPPAVSADDPQAKCNLATPVGEFWVDKNRWRRGHWEPPEIVAHGEFDSADRQRGWYATEYTSPAFEPGGPGGVFTPVAPVYRKVGTPGHWCLLHTAQPRWVDPERLQEALAARV